MRDRGLADLDVGVGAEPVDLVWRDVVDEVDFAGLQRDHPSSWLRNAPQHDPVEVGRCPPVIGIALHGNFRAGLTRYKAEWTRPDGVIAELVVAVLLDRGWTADEHRHLVEERQEIRPWVFEGDPKRGRVG